MGSIDVPNQGGENNASGEEGTGDYSEDDDDDEGRTKIQLPSGNWIPYDVMVGVSIGDGGMSGSNGWGLRGSAKRSKTTDGSGNRRRDRRTDEDHVDDGGGGGDGDAENASAVAGESVSANNGTG